MHTYTGVPASTGIVVGPVEQIDHGTTGLHRIVCDPFRERALYDVAVVLAKDELRRLSQRAKGPDPIEQEHMFDRSRANGTGKGVPG